MQTSEIISPPPPEPQPQRSMWLKYLDLATKLIALSVAASFCISIVFDYGFYFALDISLHELPTTINDHVKSCLMWLPMTLGPAIGFTFSELSRMKAVISESNKDNYLESCLLDSIRDNKHFPLPKWLRNSFYLSVVTLPISIYIKMAWSEFLFAVIIGLPFYILLLTLIWRLFMHPQIYVKGYHKYLWITLYLPSVIFLFFWLGYIGGKSNVSLRHYDYTLSTKDGHFKSTPASIIRTYDKYAFIGYSTHKLTFLPHTDISFYEKNYARIKFEDLKKATFRDFVTAFNSILNNN